MSKPLTPRQARDLKPKTIPAEVIEAFNECIVKNLTLYGTAKFTQDEVMGLICQKFGGRFTREQIYENHWLDIEPVFQKAGWVVDYDSPGFNESYSTCFEFREEVQ